MLLFSLERMNDGLLLLLLLLLVLIFRCRGVLLILCILLGLRPELDIGLAEISFQFKSEVMFVVLRMLSSLMDGR